MKRRHLSFGAILRALAFPVAAVCVLLAFLSAVRNLDGDRSDEIKQQLEQSVRRACAACYAAEGEYPPSLDHLKDYYGLQVDEERWMVSYVPVASNLMPDITVLERES